MERGRPILAQPWRAARSNQPLATTAAAATTATVLTVLPGSVRPSPAPRGLNKADNNTPDGTQPVRWRSMPSMQSMQMHRDKAREDGEEDLAEHTEPKVQELPAFTKVPHTSPDTVSEDRTQRGSSWSTQAFVAAGTTECNGLSDISHTASGESSSSTVADGGPVTLRQFRHLSEQFSSIQQVFHDQVHQLQEAMDARLQGMATRRMLDGHATLDMLNQLSAACEARFKMLESDWALQGQRLHSQEQLYSELEQQVRQTRLSHQGELGTLPRGEDLMGTLEAIQRDIDLLRSSQNTANSELMQHKAELMTLQGQNPEAAMLGGTMMWPSQPSCSSCGNVHLARAQFCRRCGKKRDDRVTGYGSPSVGSPLASAGLFEDLDARLRGLEANMTAALNQRRNESAELAVQIESVQDHLRQFEADLQTDRKPHLRSPGASVLDCSQQAFEVQDGAGIALTEDLLSMYATNNDLMAVAASCKALEQDVAKLDSQIGELRKPVVQ